MEIIHGLNCIKRDHVPAYANFWHSEEYMSAYYDFDRRLKCGRCHAEIDTKDRRELKGR